MKAIYRLPLIALAILAIMPAFVFAADAQIGVVGGIEVEEFVPIIWQCDDRVLLDEEMQPWRVSDTNEFLKERTQNYLFDGEKYQVDVVVFDKNKIQDVVVDLVAGVDIEDPDFNINCIPIDYVDFHACNARIDEEEITQFDPLTMQAYQCTLTILDSEHMYGPNFLVAQADDGINIGYTDELEVWFFNPMIELSITGDLDFFDVRPGTSSYSTVLVENNAEGGVVLDMFIAGKDWPAADTDLGRCFDPWTGALENYLSLGAFRYFAENGAYSTRMDAEDDSGYSSVVRDVDYEGYVNINYLLNAGFEEAFFNDAEILQAPPIPPGGPRAGLLGYGGNFLTAGSVGIPITFRLELPEPCYGNFESALDGSFFVFGEAV